jgi:FG-GAP-like repeat
MKEGLSADHSASRFRSWAWAAGLVLLLVGGAGLYGRFHGPGPASSGPESLTVADPVPPQEASAGQVHRFCGAACHAYPPPDTFPRSLWRREIKQAYEFFRDSNLSMDFPSQESVALYYERRAPLELPPINLPDTTAPSPGLLHRRDYRIPSSVRPSPTPRETSDIESEGLPAAVSNVNLVHLFDERRLDVLVCDMRHGQVLVLQPYLAQPAWRLLYSCGPDQGFHPCHAEVVDLDGDGVKDLLIANLGNATPTDAACGSVIWLRGLGNGAFEPHVLLQGVGRVADVQAADFRGCGKLDLVVAAFGWRHSGEILYLENQTGDWSRPRFLPRVLDDRHGAIHVPIADINGDGKPDFVALISQEHETIVAFVNEGGGFRKETIYTAPHPAYGSSGIQLVDLNNDGRPDVLYTNGDTLDPPYLLKAYHGVQWLENQGLFPFTHHPLTPMYGVMRAVAADLTGSGKNAIAAVGFLPAEAFPDRQKLQLDSVILLEQTAPRRFTRHSLETVHCDHFTCAAGDIYGDGRQELVVGNVCSSIEDAAITIWESSNPGHAAVGR